MGIQIKWRRIVSFFICITMLFSFSVPVYAFRNIGGEGYGPYTGKYNLNAAHKVNLYYTDTNAVHEIRDIIYQDLLAAGMTKAGVSGILGNMVNESGIDPTRTQSNTPWESSTYGVTGLGLVQFTYYSKQSDLFDMAAQEGKQWTDLGVQLKELKKVFSKSAYPEFYSSNDVSKCSDVMLTRYENPAVYNYSARRASSNEIYKACSKLKAKAYTGGKYGSGSGGSTSSSEESVASTSGNADGITSEDELVGMPDESNLSKNQNVPELKTQKDLMSELDDSGAESFYYIKNQLVDNKDVLTYDNARIALVFIGLLLICYAILLLMALMFDMTNNWLDVSLIGVLTLGKVHYQDDDSLADNKGYATKKRIITYSVITMIVGLLIVSGGVLPFVMKIAYKISQMLGAN